MSEDVVMSRLKACREREAALLEATHILLLYGKSLRNSLVPLNVILRLQRAVDAYQKQAS
jgi:hypothetical protein